MSAWLEVVLVFLGGVVLGWVFRGIRESSRMPLGPRPTTPEQLESEVHRLLAGGRKVQAIKRYRVFHRVGLKEARDAVEEMEKHLHFRR
jgi:ribosomal protein L7/L12